MNPPTISICIPTYNRVAYLKRLLDSISKQTHTDFEVIITDDSLDNQVYELTRGYKDKFTIFYFKNTVPLGTPENWNEAIRHARGEWIKLIHDDDWFTAPDSLARFVHAAQTNKSISFFYSAYVDVFSNGREKVVRVSSCRRKKLMQNPATLFSKNVIGPPSVTLVRNDKSVWYDNKIKWVVDIDYYIQFLIKEPPFYIDSPLVKVGIHQEQVTRESFRVAMVEVPENFYLINKVGITNLREISIYDAWWRLLRNLRITSVTQIREAGYDGDVHKVIRSMIAWQSGIPMRILNMGIFSKSIMFVHYLINRRLLR